MTEPLHNAILFADVCDSSRLYRELGDARAKDVVVACLELLAGSVARAGGTVVKYIGDEVLGRCPTAFDGLKAALDGQQAVAAAREQDRLPALVRVRMGFHAGPILLEGEDVFGDTVHVAKRVSSLAKSDQILTTRSTLDELPPGVVPARFVDTVQLKGQAARHEVHEIACGPDVTAEVLAPARPEPGPAPAPRLEVRAGERVVALGEDRPKLTIGRDASCDLVVQGTVVSRHHATIELRGCRFVYADLSTNGSCLRPEERPDRFLRRAEAPLEGRGRVLLGPAGSEGPTLEYAPR